MRLDREGLAHLRAEVVSQGGFAMRTAFEAVQHNKLRASLTSLGILFGVASVIAMLAIGNGAEQEILEQMRLLGSNNVMITPLVEQKEEQVKDQQEKQTKKFTPGLTYADALAIGRMIPAVEATSAEIVLNTTITREGRSRSGKVVGVDTTYFRLTNLGLAQGQWFSAQQVERGLPVAIIGARRPDALLHDRGPDRTPHQGRRHLAHGRRRAGRPSGEPGDRTAPRDPRRQHGRLRAGAHDAAALSQPGPADAARHRTGCAAAQVTITGEDNESRRSARGAHQPHQLDRIIVRVADAREVPAVAEIARRMLARRHNTVVDFEITVPELLLKQEQRTKTIFNVVLGAIASISLVVGGIGIMNIMLASVLERIREIGVRRAVGATQQEILFQFLSEAVLISVAGGLAGVVLGIVLSTVIERVAGIHTIVSSPSVIIAFGVSFAVGLVFGIVPAYRAARQDPVACLRYE